MKVLIYEPSKFELGFSPNPRLFGSFIHRSAVGSTDHRWSVRDASTRRRANASHSRRPSRALREGAMSDPKPSSDASFGGATKLSYGLNLNLNAPKKAGAGAGAPAKGKKPPPTLAAFAMGDSDDDDDDEDESAAAAKARANREVLKQQEALAAKRRRDAEAAAKATAQALSQDATAFDYDSVYDDIQKSRGMKTQVQNAERVERKSRYIEDLLAKAETRKKENDISYERRLLKERLKEDHLYADKDKFVTAAYRAKLEQDAKWLAEDKMKDAIEEEEDVTKRADMSSFYSNLMNRNSSTGQGMVKETRRAAPEPSDGGEIPSKSQQSLTSAAERDRELIMRATENASTANATADAAGVTLVEKLKKAEQATETTNEEKDVANADQDTNSRRNDLSAVDAARERYLARKRKAGGA